MSDNQAIRGGRNYFWRRPILRTTTPPEVGMFVNQNAQQNKTRESKNNMWKPSYVRKYLPTSLGTPAENDNESTHGVSLWRPPFAPWVPLRWPPCDEVFAPGAGKIGKSKKNEMIYEGFTMEIWFTTWNSI
jgi:hypothetical protein